MRYALVVLGLLLALPASSQARTFTVESIHHSGTVSKGVMNGIDYANGSAKEEYGDAPWVTRNGNIPLIFVVKDADESNMCFSYLRLYRNVGAARTLIAEDATARTINADQTFWTVDVTTSLFSLAVGDTALFEWELSFRDNFCFSSHLNHYFNRVLVGAPLPTIAGWRRIDTHYHTEYTDNVFEFGGHMVTVAKAAQAVGLDAVCLTDHSTDITSADWDSVSARATRFSTSNFLCIPGEELTVDSDEINQSPDNRLHLLAIGLSRWLPAPEECCADNTNSQLWTLRQGLDSVTVQNGVALAAHPAENYAVGYGGGLAVWSNQNFAVGYTYPVFVGSEFYNERKTVMPNSSVTEEYIYPYGWQPDPNWDATWQGGLTQYLGQLQTHLNPVRPLALAGGSDAHGDMSYKTTNKYGTINLSANDDALGKVHSLVYVPGTLNTANVLSALRQGQVSMSDGPVAAMNVDRDGNGFSDGITGGSFVVTPSGALQLQGQSITEFGSFSTVRLIRVSATRIDTTFIAVGGLSFSTTIPVYNLIATSGWTAVLLETRTSNGYRSVTSPVYLARQGGVDVPVSTTSSLTLLATPNPVSSSAAIALILPTAQHIDLRVYDISGREVSRVFSGNLNSGQHQFLWSRTGLPDGIFLLRLQTQTAQIERKLVLVQ